MEARLLKALSVVVFAMIFAIPAASALNLGTLQKSYDADISSGETAVFRTLFWSTDTEEHIITLNYTRVPRGWIVISLPNQFTVGGKDQREQTEKTERIYLPGAKNTIDAQAADIYITAPEKAVSGEYDIVLDAITGHNKNTGFSLVQERSLRFRINLSGGPAEKNEKNGNRTTFISISPAIAEIPEEKTLSGQTMPDAPEKNKDWALPVIMITAISIIAWRLYKYD